MAPPPVCQRRPLPQLPLTQSLTSSAGSEPPQGDVGLMRARVPWRHLVPKSHAPVQLPARRRGDALPGGIRCAVHPRCAFGQPRPALALLCAILCVQVLVSSSQLISAEESAAAPSSLATAAQGLTPPLPTTSGTSSGLVYLPGWLPQDQRSMGVQSALARSRLSDTTTDMQSTAAHQGTTRGVDQAGTPIDVAEGSVEEATAVRQRDTGISALGQEMAQGDVGEGAGWVRRGVPEVSALVQESAQGRVAQEGRRGPHQRPRLLPLFVDPLPVPRVIPAPSSGLLALSAFHIKHKFHRDMPPTPLYGFGRDAASATSPGPTILAHSGYTLRVRWGNNLTAPRHMFPVDLSLEVPRPPRGGIPISVHLHGAVVQSTHDGYPRAWFTHRGDVGPAFVSATAEYPNVQPGSTLWYHDHTIGMTRLNVAAGLAGIYILRNGPLERKLGLPSGAFDLPLAIQDKSFHVDTGLVDYPTVGDNPHVHPHWVAEYFGKYMIVNGKISPFLNVQKRKYRFRILNMCGNRFLHLKFMYRAPGLNQRKTLPFRQVATDGGFLEHPVWKGEILLAPGERAEVVVDFAALPLGTPVRLLNDANAPYSEGDPATSTEANVMEFVVKAKAKGGKDPSRVPAHLVSLPAINWSSAKLTRYITLTEVENVASGRPEVSLLDGEHFSVAANVRPKVGTVERWVIINLTGDWHPIHIHFAPHRLLHRQPFNVDDFLDGRCTIGTFGYGTKRKKKSCFTGPPRLEDWGESGWKDTVKVPPEVVTTILLRFQTEEVQDFDPRVGPGYLFHCHMLEHEDNDMMRPFLLH